MYESCGAGPESRRETGRFDNSRKSARVIIDPSEDCKCCRLDFKKPILEITEYVRFYVMIVEICAGMFVKKGG